MLVDLDDYDGADGDGDRNDIEMVGEKDDDNTKHSGCDDEADNNDDDDEDEDDDDDKDEADGSNLVLSIPPEVKIPKPPPTNKDGWPSWVTEANSYLKTHRLGNNFRRAVGWWSVVERSYSFESSVSHSFPFLLFSTLTPYL